MLDAGLILIVSAAELTQDELDIFHTSLPPEFVTVVWIGDRKTTDLSCDLVLSDADSRAHGVDALKALLEDQRAIFKPW
jgi:bifunctional enzyme CysN/CysC